MTDIKKIRLKDGRLYSVRIDRRRFFFPDEYKSFRESLRKDHHKLFFDFMILTGARVDEVMHVRKGDFDFERGNVRLWKTKTKAKKGETVGKPRTISLPSYFTKRIKSFSKDLNPEAYLWKKSSQAANQLLKRTLEKTSIPDPHNFSTHNLRKTHGMYLKALGIDVGEICTRLGHDYDTYIQHYGSADVFSDKDMRQIKDMLGDLYMRQRRY